jgi:hypothetical protein
MDISKNRSITNSFRDVRLVSLQKWRSAAEFTGCDRGGPYVVAQEGYDPADLSSTPDEFILGKSGEWLTVAHFFALPLAERRAEFVFCSAAEVMQLLVSLPTKVSILRPTETVSQTEPESDELNAVVIKAKDEGAEPGRERASR